MEFGNLVRAHLPQAFDSELADLDVFCRTILSYAVLQFLPQVCGRVGRSEVLGPSEPQAINIQGSNVLQ
jgi:hypothetical protein